MVINAISNAIKILVKLHILQPLVEKCATSNEKIAIISVLNFAIQDNYVNLFHARLKFLSNVIADIDRQ